MPEPTHLVLDIETVPDGDLFSAPEPAPGAEKAFPPLFACKPVVIGLLWLDQDFACKRIGTVGDGKDEAGMIADFAEFMISRRPHVVTWNGRSFDLPVLALRALRHGISLPWYYHRDFQYRYTEEGHLDLCDALSSHGAARLTSLGAAARLIGLPGKDGLDGSQVEGLYQAGRIEVLRQYCLSDVAQTAFLFLRYRLLAGQLLLPDYRRAAAALLTALEQDQRLRRLVERLDRPRLLLDEAVAPAPEAESAPVAS